MSTAAEPRFLLLQVRDADDPVRRQEVECFAAAIGCGVDRISTHSLLGGAPTGRLLNRHDAVLIGGSGAYSAARAEANGIERPAPAWLEPAFDALRHLHACSKPAFASCWGFQAFCRAIGGDCVHDLAHAELGPTEMQLTTAGAADPLFGSVLPERFFAHAGHEDRVTKLPAGATLLASSDTVANQAIVFAGKPIYATQFHPELTAAALIERVAAYPKYVQQIAGVPLAEFRHDVVDTPEANGLLPRFVEIALG